MAETLNIEARAASGDAQSIDKCACATYPWTLRRRYTECLSFDLPAAPHGRAEDRGGPIHDDGASHHDRPPCFDSLQISQESSLGVLLALRIVSKPSASRVSETKKPEEVQDRVVFRNGDLIFAAPLCCRAAGIKWRPSCQMTNNRPILNGDRLDAPLTAGARVALRLLLVVLLALLAINAIAILLLNAIYDPDALRHRHLWRPVLLRNLILSIPCLLVLYFSRSSADVPLAESVHGRVRSLFTRLLRILLWMALFLVAAVEAMVLTGNLVFHQTLTVTRTPSQTLNLLYSVLIGLAASVYLTRTSASRPRGGDVPIELRTTVRSLLWHSLKRSAQFSTMFAAAFIVGAYVFYKTIVEGSEFPPALLAGNLIVLAVGYVVAGVLCGAAAGGLQATRERTEQLIRGSYSLAEPLIQTLIQRASVIASTVSPPNAIVLATPERARGVLDRMVQSRFLRLLQGHWVVELLHDYASPGGGSAGDSLERLLRERLIQLTIDDVRGRLHLMLWATYALAIVLWWAPALLTLVRKPSSL
jgi:hypothetical protein